MTRRRWAADRVEGDRASLLGDHALHLSRVLRAQVGQEYDVATPAGVRVGRIVSVQDGSVDFLLGDFLPNTFISVPEITLVLAIFKFDRLEWAIEKSVELGVARIVPLLSARTEKHLAQAAGKRVDRWRRLAKQAAEQSRRESPAKVDDPQELDQALAETLVAAAPTRIVLAEEEKSHLLARALITAKLGGRVAMAIGPEGGWTRGELRKFEEAGWVSASLGPTILRAETAAIAALAVAFSHLQ